MSVALAVRWPEPDRLEEAAGGDRARVQRAGTAARDVLIDANKDDKDTLAKLLARLQQLKAALTARLLGDAGSVTDFRRFDLTARLADVDRLIAEATAALAGIAEKAMKDAGDRGLQAVEEPVRALQVGVAMGLPGLDASVVDAAFGNAVDLLTPMMRQFGTDAKIALRRVATAGDSRQAEINRLRDKIAGQGFENAAWKAERIIRTEVSRVLNTATFTRLTTLAKEFPFLKKGWRTSMDRRVRFGHVEAGKTYARGLGIPVAHPFLVNAYDERPGKTPKLIGIAKLLYPVDPNVEPHGKIGAASTILCRCNAFVDIDMAAFQAFTKAKVQQAFQNVLPPPPPQTPQAPAMPAAPKPVKKVRSVKPRVTQPKVGVPTAADLRAPVAGEPGPAGTKVSAAIRVEAGYEKVSAALAEIDRVHGDGPLPTIPAGPVAARFRSRAAAYYLHDGDNQAVALGFTKKLLGANPFMTVWHEMGHFIDHYGIGVRGLFASESIQTGAFAAFRDGSEQAAFTKVMQTIRGSKAIQTMSSWGDFDAKNGVKPGNGTIPLGVDRKMLHYMLRSRESFARAYAQYIAVTSGNEDALKALKNMQASSTTGPVPADRPFNRNQTTRGVAPQPNTWDYPWQWQDDDYEPIRAAFDELFVKLGWRKSGK